MRISLPQKKLQGRTKCWKIVWIQSLNVVRSCSSDNAGQHELKKQIKTIVIKMIVIVITSGIGDKEVKQRVSIKRTQIQDKGDESVLNSETEG